MATVTWTIFQLQELSKKRKYGDVDLTKAPGKELAQQNADKPN
jgi:hypothetical protein